MAIPISYNIRSLGVRWSSTLVAVIGIAGTVGVFVAMLALANGFKSTLVHSGLNDNAIVLRGGATSEMMSGMGLDQVKVIADMPGVARKNGRSSISPEVVVIAAFPLKSTGTDANVQVRGVSPQIFDVRPNVHIAQGRTFEPGRNELIVGRNVQKTYVAAAGVPFNLGQTVRFGGGEWTVVGVFDAGGSAFDSEIWCDSAILDQVYKRPQNSFQSLTVHLENEAAFQKFKDAVTTDPRLTMQVQREREYYEKQSRVMSTLITVLGGLVAVVMAVGAILGALNTMYSAVSERGREIATMRALGFGAGSVVLSFMIEAICIAIIGGVVGCLAVLPINGLTTGTMNFQTFSHLAFAFQVTPPLIIGGLIFSVFMGILGGVPPAVRAARARIAVALREL
ncbi:ABC efflux pump, inner membrane subunit [Candidatus Koribacter versatilis Ellin345]|uniref:ABC efflux pump, inner membrane subunit n=1 Tax=Koribacter versatilis (strain Ellin345) TaxID=204669 RepID=Q1IR80_KORVE|nr:ABC transporter permease [Candidatus Koribacter versatilis]ABF40620.1 ABC efflux pump, inner membrane subunit [Candidatus Koribacter versatilis Ellin345]